jgi:hypothetical protein
MVTQTLKHFIFYYSDISHHSILANSHEFHKNRANEEFQHCAGY